MTTNTDMRRDFDARLADLKAVQAAMKAHKGEDVIFDALAAYEDDKYAELMYAPSPTLADVLTKLRAFASLGLSDTDMPLDLIIRDMERLLAEGAKQ
jgi:hypothetical protein